MKITRRRLRQLIKEALGAPVEDALKGITDEELASVIKELEPASSKPTMSRRSFLRGAIFLAAAAAFPITSGVFGEKAVESKSDRAELLRLLQRYHVAKGLFTSIYPHFHEYEDTSYKNISDIKRAYDAGGYSVKSDIEGEWDELASQIDSDYDPGTDLFDLYYTILRPMIESGRIGEEGFSYSGLSQPKDILWYFDSFMDSYERYLEDISVDDDSEND